MLQTLNKHRCVCSIVGCSCKYKQSMFRRYMGRWTRIYHSESQLYKTRMNNFVLFKMKKKCSFLLFVTIKHTFTWAIYVKNYDIIFACIWSHTLEIQVYAKLQSLHFISNGQKLLDQLPEHRKIPLLSILTNGIHMLCFCLLGMYCYYFNGDNPTKTWASVECLQYNGWDRLP